MSILMAEYDYATDLAVQKEEAYEDGLFAGLERGLATGREEGITIGLERGLEQGLERGAYQTKLETARSMLSRMLPADLVVDCTSLPLEIVQQLEREVSPKP